MQRLSKALLALASVTLIGLLAGCGSDSGTSTPQRVADAWQNPYLSQHLRPQVSFIIRGVAQDS